MGEHPLPLQYLLPAISTTRGIPELFSFAPLIGKRCENALIEAIKVAERRQQPL